MCVFKSIVRFYTRFSDPASSKPNKLIGRNNNIIGEHFCASAGRPEGRFNLFIRLVTTAFVLLMFSNTNVFVLIDDIHVCVCICMYARVCVQGRI